ncbi:alkanesulfonate monooxygenase SsuD/methylene tetrahydromethanopterin reductase-like flavin-dependent oxidoreductase (luciferase family) [Jatrophihabitans sp. GAS493]|uniref:LLM class flavin-dependent oxidoreductase n=1 Tax=Jatrophihabitans sp. GAS493 TaxID=1907575 RepID=UPI000BB92F78|nr:LLM class flavin-dependent oxidoreductase [Jatrophihabitans sp. GAS493]SOD74864.1 alkanesulfonate monooxygenase SsuD/methylene tetrahydromethanopterin reductase-like flavin-dependent oxidoreductase (luciferase family) [Jatrophihabitans sp. GAS493]
MPEPVVPVHLAAALDGAGWHPAAWREPNARPTELLDARYWADLAGEAERGLLDFITLEDSLGLQTGRYLEPDRRTDQVRGRLDAVLTAARIAPLSKHIGIIATALVTHTEPFHLSKAIATLDYVSTGRAGVQVKVSGRADEAALFGRREIPAIRFEDFQQPAAQRLIAELFDEAEDYVEVLRRLWDSWEDDAEIRDVATGRFVDREKLHYIDFAGRRFSVKGPSITPRPPQGQPIVSALAHQERPYQLVATSADIGYITPTDAADAARIVKHIRSLQVAAGREHETVHVFADLVVFLDGDSETGSNRRERLDAAAGEEYRSDAQIFTGSAAQLADLVAEWQQAGIAGFRLRPAVLPDDLESIGRRLVPELQRRGLFRTEYQGSSLRDLLGLPRAANRYAA